ncbi:oxidoreductase [Chlorella sorokiniana]|uniref:Oxidoreductase n=1 Tax=Chlorella sorokiniana TaxID=3076 RepID=A0A2P6TKA4_CHLSO|nr:oxidoreductase [Chlorella sorokiniana]|eukprot:PRW44524.1 oxidoreductase [Chlorella sorokiniana]
MASPAPTSPPPQLYFSPAGEAELWRHYDAAVATLPAPHTERYVQTASFGRVHVLECGPTDAPPLVLWHGTACPGPFMLSAGFGFRALTERFRVIVPDIPLQSGSRTDPVNLDPSAHDHGRWAAEVLAALGMAGAPSSTAEAAAAGSTDAGASGAAAKARPPLQMGVSLGGALLLDIMATHPESVGGAVLVVPGSLHPEAGHSWLPLRASLAMLLHWVLRRDWTGALVARLMMAEMCDEPDSPDPAMRAVRLAFRHVRFFPEPPRTATITDDALRAFKAPVLLIAAEHDVFGPGRGTIERARRLWPDSQCEAVLLEGHKHMPSTKDTIDPGAMAKRMQELIEAGLVEDGELLRYKSKKGQVLALGRAREGGIEVEGKAKLLGFTAFEAVAGSGYHRPALHTHTIAGRNLQELQLQAAGVEAGGGGPGVGSRTRHAQQAEQEAAAMQLLEDVNDDLCHICGLGGDLVCCETCPAVYHADCVGLPGPPEGEYHCPRCRCSTCGKGGSDGIVLTGCQWVDCQAFVGPDTLQQQPRPFAGASGGSGVKPEPAAAGEAAAAAGGPEPMQVDGAAVPGTADFSSIAAAAGKEVLQGGVPIEASQAAQAAQAAVAEATDRAAMLCPVTGRWSHWGCFPPEFAEQLRRIAFTQPCISCALAATTSQRLAAVCAAGLLPLGSIAEGARAAGGSTAADAGSGSSGFVPLPLSLLVVRGAAVAAPADCRGHSPAYAPEQRRQLQVSLSAALQVLHSCYDPLPDSRTGADMLPWLLRGAVLAGGRADYSGVHTALLYAGRAVVGVAVFRCFGEVAELPLLAVRPELQQRNGLGRLLLAAVEQLLLAAGAKVLLMPGFAADGSPYLPAQAAAGGVQPVQPPPLLQSKWGYALAKREQLLASCQHPLLRLPGVLLVSKALSSSSVLPPPRLPQRLQWAGSLGLDARQLLKQGVVAAVNIPRPAAEPSAGASRPPRPAGGQRGAAVSKLDARNFVPTMPPARSGAGAASAAAIGLTVEQSMLLRMYQQQMAAAAKSHADMHAAAGPAAVYQQMLLQSAGQQQQQQVEQVEQEAAGAPRPPPAFEASKQEFAVPGLAPQSAWNQKSLAIKYPPLKENISADVVVIGAGIAGLSCAYNLAKEGKKVVVLESRTRGAGQTGRTTAHIMTWLDDYYYECESMHGLEKTKVVAQSLRSAVDWIENVVREEGIECKFKRVDGYLYPHLTGESPMPTSGMSALKKELEAAHRAGLTDTECADLGGGPEVGSIKECLRFPNNGEFHPLMYLEGLAAAVERRGGKIYEGTKAWSVESDHVETDTKLTIKCDATVLATNSPCNHNLAVHARQLPYRTYAVGILAPKSKVKRAEYWDTGEPYHYVRFDDWDDDHYLLIVGGEDHKTGSLWPYDPYDRLEKYARARWTDVTQTVLKWNGQVMEPADMLYLHGRNPLVPDGSNYIITGDSGQGMTGGTIGGIVVADLILGRKNPWADVYDPARPPPAKSLMELAEEGAITTASFAERVLPKITLSYEMEPDSLAIVQKGLSKVAVYCDEHGKQHAYTAICPHMGCLLHTNSIEKTFDCPCHGSHFDRWGKVINGPAKGDLKPIEDWAAAMLATKQWKKGA